MALRQRQTETASAYFKAQEKEDKKIASIIEGRLTLKTVQRRLKKPAHTEEAALSNGHLPERDATSDA
jgi:hypothetical protein